MTELACKSIERRQEYEVPRLHSTHAWDGWSDTPLWSCTPNCGCTPDIHPCNHFRLLHHLEVLEDGWKGRQPSDGIHVQEGRTDEVLRPDGGVVGVLHRIQMATTDRRNTDSRSIHLLVIAGKQSHNTGKTNQKVPCVSLTS